MLIPLVQERIKWLHEELGLSKKDVATLLRKYVLVGELEWGLIVLGCTGLGAGHTSPWQAGQPDRAVCAQALQLRQVRTGWHPPGVAAAGLGLRKAGACMLCMPCCAVLCCALLVPCWLPQRTSHGGNCRATAAAKASCTPAAHTSCAAAAYSAAQHEQGRRWLLEQGVPSSKLPRAITRFPHLLIYRCGHALGGPCLGCKRPGRLLVALWLGGCAVGTVEFMSRRAACKRACAACTFISHMQRPPRAGFLAGSSPAACPPRSCPPLQREQAVGVGGLHAR